MIDRIIDEIKVCLNSNCFLVALNSALTLPDICGKAEYPNEKSKRSRYVLWYDEYITKNEKSNQSNELPILNGNVVWNLRNNTLHQATFDFEGEKFKLTDWELFVQSPNGNVLNGGFSILEKAPIKKNVDVDKFIDDAVDSDEKDFIITKRFLSISLLDLVYKICACAKGYYRNNKEKFDFLKNRIALIDYNTRKSLKIKQIDNYAECFKLEEEKTKSQWDILY